MTATTTASRARRDPLFDVIRSVALVRVVLWHAFAAPWLSWAFAAMPAMFFTAGVMLAQSLERGSYRRVLRTRARRLLLPLWAFGVAVGASALVHATRSGDGVPGGAISGWSTLVDVARWLFPVTDPPGPAWQSGWLVSHLWYLRAYLWMVLAGPLVVAAARRPRLAATVAGVGVAAVELAHRVGLPLVGGGPGRLALGDVTCYGLFAVLGAAWHDRRPTPTATRASVVRWASAAAVLSGAALALVWIGGLPTGVANDSYPVLTLIGGAWLAVVLLAERPLRAVVAWRPVDRAVAALNRRAVSVYLWHPVAIVAALALVPGRGPLTVAGIVAVVTAGTALAVAAFGWVEDLGARRPRSAGPARPPRAATGPLLVGAMVALAVVAVALPVPQPATAGEAGRRVPPPPSDRAALADSAFDRRRTSSVPDGAGPGADHPLALDADHLQSTLDQWSADHPGVGPVRVSVALGGDRWSGRSGTTPGHDVDGPEHRPPDEPDDGFTTASITKLFTAALVLQEAATGHIDLDATVPETIGVTPPAVPVTPRMLLQHSSGLANYPDVVDYDPDRLYTPAEAVSLSTRAALLFDPGTDVHYSNSNFLWLGLLLEQVTGETYENLLHQRILDPLGMVRTSLDTTPTPGWAGFSSGAVASTGDDLVTFADALFARDAVLPPGWLAAMTDVDHLNVGLGAWPFCPCGTSDDGHKWFTSIGHTNAWGGLSYRPDGGAVAFVRLDAAPPDVLALHDDVLAAIWEALETPAQA